MSLTKLSRIFLILLLAIFVVFGLFLYFTPSAVLYRYKSSTAVDPADGLMVIFNPFRGRHPENTANLFLNSLKDGKCYETLAEIPLESESKVHICEKESEYPMKNWHLVDSIEEGDQTILHFNAVRKAENSEYYSNTWITLIKHQDKWQVVEFSSWY